MPTKVLVSVTPELQRFLQTSLVENAHEYARSSTVDIDDVYRLVDEHHQRGGETVKIHEILEGSQVVERVTSEPPLTELERMRLESQERAYQRSVEGLAPMRESQRREVGAQSAGLKFATNFATQVIVAFIGAFLFGYYFVENFVAADNFTLKVIVGAGCSFLTLLLESILFVVHEERSRMIKEKRRQIDQRRQDNLAAAVSRKAAAEAAQAEASTAQVQTAATEDAAEQRAKPMEEKKQD
mmetsp:Transcript_52449/g.125321  ORF Transcript_52449/g.125321 Transcript_52449/m.125321 type:complete len:241 (-) Transcript_52449:83-805(-)